MVFPRTIAGAVAVAMLSSTLIGCSGASGDYESNAGQSASSDPSKASSGNAGGGAPEAPHGALKSPGTPQAGAPEGTQANTSAMPSVASTANLTGSAQNPTAPASPKVTPPAESAAHAVIRDELVQALQNPGTELIHIPASLSGIKEWRVYATPKNTTLSVQGWTEGSAGAPAAPAIQVISHLAHGLLGVAHVDGQAMEVSKAEGFSKLSQNDIARAIGVDFRNAIAQHQEASANSVQPQFKFHLDCLFAVLGLIATIVELIQLPEYLPYIGTRLVSCAGLSVFPGCSSALVSITFFAIPIILTVVEGLRCLQEIQADQMPVRSGVQIHAQ